MVRVYRSIDGLSATAYRGLSFLVTMLPLLFLSEVRDFEAILPFVIPIVAASFVTVFANWAIATAYDCLPVGIASGVGLSVSAISVAGIAYVAFDERLSILQILLIALLIAGVILLGFSRAPRKPVHSYRPLPGLVAAVVFGVSIASGNSLLSLGARRLDPMLSAYLWECGVGVIALLLAFVRGVSSGKGLERISLRDFGAIAFYSSPTVLGTACLTLAMSLGPLALIQAVLTLITISSTFLAWWLYKEKLEVIQWILLVYCCGVVALLKLVTSW